MSDRKVLHKVYVDEERWACVKVIAAEMRVSASELVRQSLDQVLDVAEAQQRTIEATRRKLGLDP